MKDVTSCMFLSFLSFLLFQHGASAHLARNEARVGLYYGFDLAGHVEQTLRERNEHENFWYLHIPNWMQPYGQNPLPEGLHFFIRTDTPEHYEARLHASNHVELRRYTSIPEVAKVRLGRNIFKTVGEFSFYNPMINSTLDSPFYPPTNRIYVFMRNGPTYSAPVVRETMEASSSSSH